jgi:hypothetical protein
MKTRKSIAITLLCFILLSTLSCFNVYAEEITSPEDEPVIEEDIYPDHIELMFVYKDANTHDVLYRWICYDDLTHQFQPGGEWQLLRTESHGYINGYCYRCGCAE